VLSCWLSGLVQLRMHELEKANDADEKTTVAATAAAVVAAAAARELAAEEAAADLEIAEATEVARLAARSPVGPSRYCSPRHQRIL